MKIASLTAHDAAHKGAGASLLIKADAEFLSKLTLGQIIKGRVLRSYENNRHAVDFYGQEKVVDSAVPLRSGEILYGRVVSLGPQVELHRLAPETATAIVEQPGTASETVAVPIFSGDAAQAVNELFARYNAKLDIAEARVLEREVARATDRKQMALSGLVLNKLGLRMDPALLNAVFGTLTRKSRQALFALPRETVELAHVQENTGQNDESVRALAQLLQQLTLALPEAKWGAQRRRPERDLGPMGEPHDQDPNTSWPEAQDQLSLARWLLNTQTGGSIAHRVASLPILLNDELVELDVALFEQQGGSQEQEAAVAYRQIALSLDTQGLGRVEIRVALAGTRMRVTLSTDSSEATEFLAYHAQPLTEDLSQLGWEVDQLQYQTLALSTANAVVQSVVEHIISPGSVSRLI